MSSQTPPVTWLQSEKAPLRRIWQVPTFILGVVAFFAVVLSRPSIQQQRNEGTVELSKARELLESAEGDPEAAIQLVEGFLSNPNHVRNREGEAAFLQGKAQVRMAQARTEKEARSHWEKAWTLLEKGLKRGVSKEDQGPLLYYLGTAGFYSDQEPQKVVEYLNQSIEHAEDKVLGYQLLTQAWLRLPVPDYEKALEANQKLRQLPLLGEKVLAPARLTAGELLLELKRTSEARKMLARITPEAASSEVYARARGLQAESHQNEEQWAEAAQIWEELLNHSQVKIPDRGGALFRLGICYRRLSQPEDAIRAWTESIAQGSKSSVVAAHLGLGDVLLGREKPLKVLGHLQAVTKDVASPDEWLNDHVSLKQAQAVLERAILFYLEKGIWDPAVEVSQLYEKLAPSGQAHFLQGEVRRNQAEAIAGEAPEVQKQQKELFRMGGEAYEKGATLTRNNALRTEWLWLASACYAKADSSAQNVSVLQALLKQNLPPERVGEAYYRLGDALQAEQKLEAAQSAYTQCINYPGTYAYRSRFQLAQIEYRRGETGPATDLLRDNIKQLRHHSDPVALEGSLYTLGKILFERGDFNEVRRYLQEALERFPKSDRRQRARWQLAEASFLQGRKRQKELPPVGGDDKTRATLEEEARKLLVDAAVLYAQLRKTLPKDRGKIEPIQPKEELNIAFREVDALFYAGYYDASLARCDLLVEKFKGKPNGLLAMGYTIRCYVGLQDEAGFKRRVELIRKELQNYDARTRLKYEQWFNDMSRSFTILRDRE